MKYFLVVSGTNKSTIGISEEMLSGMDLTSNPEVIYYKLPDGSSLVAERYDVVDGAVNDKYPTYSDQEVFEMLELERETSSQNVEEIKLARLREVRDYFSDVIKKVKSDNAEYELETWSQQQAEFTRYHDDPTKPIPWISGLAKGRGVTVDVMVELIGRKIETMASIQGRQHYFEKLIKDSTTVSEVKSIEISL